MKDAKLPGNRLTVVIRNDAPMVHCNDSSSYRSVSIQLTDEQRKALALKYAFSCGGEDHYEQISKCFIEREEERYA